MTDKITLRDIYEIVDRLETKMDKRLCLLENRTNTLESFKDNLAGKITLFVGVLSICITIVWDWLKGKLKI